MCHVLVTHLQHGSDSSSIVSEQLLKVFRGIWRRRVDFWNSMDGDFVGRGDVLARDRLGFGRDRAETLAATVN